MPRRGISLSEEHWRLAKSLAAKRGQTLSEFFRDLLTGGPPKQADVSKPAKRS